MDGKVVIGCSMTTKELQRDLTKAKKELQNFANEEERLLNKKSTLEINTQKTERDMTNLEAKINAIKQKLEQEKNVLNDIPEWKQKTPEYARQVDTINKIQLQYDGLVAKADDLNDKYQNQVNTLEQVNQKLIKNGINQEKTKQKIVEIESSMNKIPINVKNIGNGVSDVVRKVGKWALAIFSVRSAYSLIRKTVSTLSQYNQQLATNIKYIEYAFATVVSNLAQVLMPIIKTIINWIYVLLAYIRYFVHALFDIDIFAGATADSFQQVAGGLGEANSNAQKLQKTLAGFDEMNVLEDNSSSGSGVSGGGGVSAPSFDLGDIENIQLNKKITDFLDGVASALKTVYGWFEKLGLSASDIFGIIITLWGGSKILKAIKNIGSLTGSLSTIAQIGIVAVGVDILYNAITGRNLIEDLKEIYNAMKLIAGEHSEANVAKKVQDIQNSAKGAEKLKDYTTQNATINGQKTNISEKDIFGKQMADQIKLYSKQISQASKNNTIFEQTADNLSLIFGGSATNANNLKTQIDSLIQSTLKYSNALEDEIKKDNLSTATKTRYKNSLIEVSKQYSDYLTEKALSNSITLQDIKNNALLNERMLAVGKSTGLTKDVVDTYNNSISSNLELINEQLERTDLSQAEEEELLELRKMLVGNLVQLKKDTEGYIVVGDEYIDQTMLTKEKLAELKKQVDDGTISQKDYDDMLKDVYLDELDVGDAGARLAKKMQENKKSTEETSKEYGIFGTAAQGVIDKLKIATSKTWTIDSKLNKPNTNDFENSLSNAFSRIGGALGVIGINLPKFASGGIVNLPGRGIPVGGAFTGEAGPEGVIPLTDSQAMETLGSIIGRNATINLTVVNSMNGRVISRELKTINNSNDFMTNS